MVNPEKSHDELEHLHDVNSEQENMGTAPLAPSPSLTPIQGGKRIANQGASSSSKKQRLDFPSDSFGCRFCVKTFQSQNAVNGHMRMHKARKEKEKESGANRRDTLSQLGQQVLLASSPSSRPDGLVIDLNKPPPTEEEDGDNGKNIMDADGLVIDLNKPPPTEKEDGDNGKNIMDADGYPIY